jgi:hypothetical protein
VALPLLTPEQRAAALEKAARARKQRAELKNRLKRGSTTLPQVLAEGQTDEIIGRTKVSTLLESLPGIGKVRASQIMEQLGIAESRRVRGLSARQRTLLGTVRIEPSNARGPGHREELLSPTYAPGGTDDRVPESPMMIEDWDR